MTRSGILIRSPNVEILVGHGRRCPENVHRRTLARNEILTTALQKYRDQFFFPVWTGAWSPQYIALGTDSTAVTSADVALGNEVFRGSISKRLQEGDTEGMAELYVDDTQANGYELCEAGMFTEASGGEPWARVVFPGIQKTALVWIILRWYVSFSYVEA